MLAIPEPGLVSTEMYFGRQRCGAARALFEGEEDVETALKAVFKVAAEKNKKLASDAARPVLKTLLQRQFWAKVKTTVQEHQHEHAAHHQATLAAHRRMAGAFGAVGQRPSKRRGQAQTVTVCLAPNRTAKPYQHDQQVVGNAQCGSNKPQQPQHPHQPYAMPSSCAAQMRVAEQAGLMSSPRGQWLPTANAWPVMVGAVGSGWLVPTPEQQQQALLHEQQQRQQWLHQQQMQQQQMHHFPHHNPVGAWPRQHSTAFGWKPVLSSSLQDIIAV